MGVFAVVTVVAVIRPGRNTMVSSHQGLYKHFRLVNNMNVTVLLKLSK